MEKTRVVMYPNGFSYFDIDEKVAKIIGLKTEDDLYKSLDPVQETLFTNPPHFSVDERLIPYIVKFAKSKGVFLVNTIDPLAASNELIEKLG